MGIDVTVLRVFTDSDGQLRQSPRCGRRRRRTAAERQQLATNWVTAKPYSSICPQPGATTASAHIFTPAAELPFAGHPTVGAAWLLSSRGTPVEHPAGARRASFRSAYDGDLTAVSARSEWAPEFAIHDLESVDEVAAADPDDYSDDVEHYLWAWTDEPAGEIRSRMFAPDLGIRGGRGDRGGGSADDRLPQP